MSSLIDDFFPNAQENIISDSDIQRAIIKVCEDSNYVHDDAWSNKILQLFNMQKIHHGIIMVGPGLGMWLLTTIRKNFVLECFASVHVCL